MKLRDRLPKSSALITVLIAGLVIAVALILNQIPDSAATVEVELTSSKSGVAELFVNGADQWRQATVEPGPQTITFIGIEGPLTSIRVDPLAIADERITIHRVSVLDSQHRMLATFAGQDFARWVTYNAKNAVIDADGLTLTTVTGDTAVTSIVDIQTDDRSRITDRLVQRWRQPFPATELVLGLPVVIIAVGSIIRRRFGVIVLLVGPVAIYLADHVAGSTVGVTPADQAFGAPGFGGLDASYPRRFLALATSIAILLSLLVLALRRQFPSLRRTSNQSWSPEPLAVEFAQPDTDSSTVVDGEAVGWRARVGLRLRRLPWSRLMAILAIPLLYAIIRLPSAPQITSALTGPISTRDWDYANLRTWDHLLASREVPMRDFWYPYGNLGYLRMGVIGATIDWAASVVCLTAFSSSLWRLSQRATPVIIGTVAVAAIDLQFFTGGLRYLVPLAFTVWFATTRRTGGRERWAALAAIVIAPLIAADVGAYTLLAAIGVLVADELTIRGLGDSVSRRRILRDSLAIATGVVGFILLWLLRGGLGPTSELILGERTTSAYAGAILPVATTIKEVPGYVLFVFPFAAIALALYSALRRRGRDLHSAWIPALAGLGIYGLFVLAKHLIRPGLQGVLAMICVAAIAIAIASVWHRSRSQTAAIAAGALVGTLVVQAGVGTSAEQWQLAINNAPSKAIELLAAFTWERTETLLYRSTISPGQMAAYSEELAAADAVAAISAEGRIYVLGDAQYLYPITGRSPYWTVSSWDTSPFDTQKRVIDELATDPPAVVVFEPRDDEFDGIPSELRLPLIYLWVVERYSFHSTVGPYELLTPRDSSTGVDWSYWRTMLGTTLDMGRLPAATTAAGDTCDLDTDTSGHCLAYLTIDVKPVDTVVTRIITVSGSSGFFRLSFSQRPGDHQLTIPLGRMWFWTQDSTVLIPSDWVLHHSIHGARDTVLY